MFATDEYKWRRITPYTFEGCDLEGKNVRIGRWIMTQRDTSANSVNSERYRLLKEHKMLDPIIENKGKQKIIRLV